MKSERKYKIICQLGEYKIFLPCNWVSQGFGGLNGKKCDLQIIVEEDKR